MHDTYTFGDVGEDGSKPGLNNAIENFMFFNKGIWKIKFETPENNGLTILERI